MNKSIVQLAKENGYTPKEFIKEIQDSYAASISMEMDRSKSDLVIQTTLIGNEEITISVTRKFINEQNH